MEIVARIITTGELFDHSACDRNNGIPSLVAPDFFPDCFGKVALALVSLGLPSHFASEDCATCIDCFPDR